MRHNKLDLNLLVALDALLTDCSVSRAADRVFLTQSAMSSALGRLRQHFKDELVTQVGRKMVRTEKGEAIWPEVRAILLRIGDVTRPMADFDPAKDSRTFRISASDYFCHLALPSLMQHIDRHAPSVQLEVIPLSPRLNEELERGEVDLLIVPELLKVRGSPSQMLFRDEWVCVSAKNNPRLTRMTLAKYLELEHVVKRQNHLNFPTVDESVVSAQKIKRRVVAQVPQYALLALAVAETSRIATVQRGLATMWAKWLPLQVHKLPFECPPLQEMMQWHKSRENDLGHAWLRDTLLGLCANLDLRVGGASKRRQVKHSSRRYEKLTESIGAGRNAALE